MKKSIIGIVLLAFLGFVGYKVYSENKKQAKLEARFDRFMNYWYPIVEQYSNDMDIYARMKKGVIMDHINYHQGRYINDVIQLYGGGYFSIRQYSNIEREIELFGFGISPMASSPISAAPYSRGSEKEAFFNIFRCGTQLNKIDDYESELEYDYDYREKVFNKIDSLSNEVRKNLLILKDYKRSSSASADLNILNNIPDSEYELNNY